MDTMRPDQPGTMTTKPEFSSLVHVKPESGTYREGSRLNYALQRLWQAHTFGLVEDFGVEPSRRTIHIIVPNQTRSPYVFDADDAQAFVNGLWAVYHAMVAGNVTICDETFGYIAPEPEMHHHLLGFLVTEEENRTTYGLDRSLLRLLQATPGTQVLEAYEGVNGRNVEYGIDVATTMDTTAMRAFIYAAFPARSQGITITPSSPSQGS